MVRAAVLGAEEVVRASLSHLEPDAGVSAWNDILFHPEGRDEEIVDHVLGSHGQLDRAADRDVQLVDLPHTLRVLEVPHPLLADHKDLARRGGRARVLNVEARTPQKHHHGQEKRDRSPRDFDGEKLGDPRGPLVLRAAAIFDREIEYGEENQRREKQIDRGQEVVQMVYSPRDGRGLVGT